MSKCPRVASCLIWPHSMSAAHTALHSTSSTSANGERALPSSKTSTPGEARGHRQGGGHVGHIGGEHCKDARVGVLQHQQQHQGQGGGGMHCHPATPEHLRARERKEGTGTGVGGGEGGWCHMSDALRPRTACSVSRQHRWFLWWATKGADSQRLATHSAIRRTPRPRASGTASPARHAQHGINGLPVKRHTPVCVDTSAADMPQPSSHSPGSHRAKLNKSLYWM